MERRKFRWLKFPSKMNHWWPAVSQLGQLPICSLAKDNQFSASELKAWQFHNKFLGRLDQSHLQYLQLKFNHMHTDFKYIYLPRFSTANEKPHMWLYLVYVK